MCYIINSHDEIEIKDLQKKLISKGWRWIDDEMDVYLGFLRNHLMHLQLDTFFKIMSVSLSTKNLISYEDALQLLCRNKFIEVE